MKLKRCDFIAQVKMIGESSTVYSVCSTREGRPWCDLDFDGTTVTVRYSKEHLERIGSSADGIRDALYVPVSNVKFYTLVDGEVHVEAHVEAVEKRGPGRPPKLASA